MSMADPTLGCSCPNDSMGTHTHLAADFHPGGMAQKVYYDQGGSRYRYGLSFIWPVCDECGAVLADQPKHDEWHWSLANEETD